MPEVGGTVHIGMPVYNGAAFIERALESVRRQRLADWRLVVSDNGSTDGTGALVKRHLVDPRITYHRQAQNLGAMGNFAFLLGQAASPLFCWVAADDEWDEAFLTDAVGALAAHPERGTAFTGMVNVDAAGQEIRAYPFMQVLAGPPGRDTATRYAAFLEYLGKANLIYGLHRTEACRAAWQGMERIEAFKRRYLDPGRFVWGADMAFGLRLVTATGLAHSAPVRFRKRIPDHAGGRLPEHWGHRSLPLGADLGEYLFALLLASWESTAFGDLCAVLARRLEGEEAAVRLPAPCPSLEGPALQVAPTRVEAMAPLLRSLPGHHLLEWLAHLAAAEAEEGESSRAHLARVMETSPSPALVEEARRLLQRAAPAATEPPRPQVRRNFLAGR